MIFFSKKYDKRLFVLKIKNQLLGVVSLLLAISLLCSAAAASKTLNLPSDLKEIPRVTLTYDSGYFVWVGSVSDPVLPLEEEKVTVVVGIVYPWAVNSKMAWAVTKIYAGKHGIALASDPTSDEFCRQNIEDQVSKAKDDNNVCYARFETNTARSRVLCDW